MSRRTLNIWVGFFVAVSMGALVFLALRVGNSSSFQASKTYALHSAFDNIGGLKVRGPVKSAGVVVGRVADIQLDKASYQADVTLYIDSRYQFPKDTFASILTSGLLGEQYIGLDAGGDSVNLKDGDKIVKTQSAVVLEKLISQFLFSKAADGKEGDAQGKK